MLFAKNMLYYPSLKVYNLFCSKLLKINVKERCENMSCAECSHEVQRMCCVAKGANHGPAPIPKRENGSNLNKLLTSAVLLTVWVGVLPSRVHAN